MLSRRWPWLLILLLVAFGAARLRFDAEVLHLLPTGLPAVRGLLLQQQYFAAAKELLITLSADDVGLAERAAAQVARRLEAEPGLVKSVRWSPPWEEQPTDLAENLAWQWLQQEPAAFTRLEERLQPGALEPGLQRALDDLASSMDPGELVRTGYDPLGLSRLEGGTGRESLEGGRRFFSDPSGTFRLLHVEPAVEERDYRETARWLARIRAATQTALRELGEAEGSRVRAGFTGGPAFRAEISAGMESDLRQSIVATVILIAGLFWVAHRTWRPLAWLVFSLGLTLILTLGVGGLIFGTLNIISVGFAAVLMGLAVDYGLVGYQEAVASPGAPPRQIRHEVSRGIWYSAVTTAGTFVLLGWVGLPGLSLLGQMTALGLLVGAVVMLHVYLPRVCPVPLPAAALPQARPTDAGRAARTWERLGWWPTGIVLAGVAVVLCVRGFPRVTSSEDPLKPRSSPAYTAMDEMRSRLGRTREPALLVIEGRDAEEVARRMAATAVALGAEAQDRPVERVELPLAFWPRPEHARSNAAIALRIAARAGEITAAVQNAGFSTNATALVDRVLAAWPALVSQEGAWPTNATASWLVRQFAARTENGGWAALGILETGPQFDSVRSVARLPAGVWLSSWDTLGQHLLAHVRGRVVALTFLIALVLVGCLWLAFRRWAEVGLAAAALASSFLVLVAVMAAAGWEWNLLSLVALPLILGTSVDSTIHVQLALRRYHGRLPEMWHTTGKALVLCAGANIAGFGSLAWSSNMGLASLDLACALGVGCVFVVCVGLLPHWWLAAGLATPATLSPVATSSLYQARLWQAGLVLARHTPARLAVPIAIATARAYRRLNPKRYQVVVDNLLPVLSGDPAAARASARRVFDEFARKLVELWRQEAGAPAIAPVVPGDGWEHFQAARETGRGVLLVTPHLGNWEIGSALLTSLGVRPMVLTAPEPGEALTEARLQARRRLGVDTVVVGSDPFAFVPVIQRLQSGGVVALLIDRAVSSSTVATEFLGRPFRTSVAAAELARASGAILLPVYIVREGARHRAHTLPAIDYDRRALSDRSARADLAGRILRAFEPAVRQFPDQWFHFVPAWDSRDGSPQGPP